MFITCTFLKQFVTGQEDVALDGLSVGHVPKPRTGRESLLLEERGEKSVQAKRARVVNYSLL